MARDLQLLVEQIEFPFDAVLHALDQKFEFLFEIGEILLAHTMAWPFNLPSSDGKVPSSSVEQRDAFLNQIIWLYRGEAFQQNIALAEAKDVIESLQLLYAQ